MADLIGAHTAVSGLGIWKADAGFEARIPDFSDSLSKTFRKTR
jgi:hypothetical protein